MQRDEIIRIVNDAVIEVGEHLDPHRVLESNDRLSEDLGLDYEKVNDLTRVIEGSFGIFLARTDYPRRENLVTLGDVYDLLCNKLIRKHEGAGM